ncbi:MAG: hypothetical protein ACO25B_12495 [Chitinophagaceae bacterium]
MEVHAHTHTPRKKWTHYFWEFLMLFLAVFCGFLAENQREHYIEKHRAKQFARSLVADLEADKEDITEIIEQINNMIAFIDTLGNYTLNKPLSQLDNFELLSRIYVGLYRPYTWSRATLDQIKNSGSLRFFTNQDIVKKISAYDAFTRHLDEDAKGDEQRNDLLSQKICEVFDLNYPPVYLAKLYYSTDPQSLFDTLRVHPEIHQFDPKPKKLLTDDLNEVKKVINLGLSQRPHLVTRGQMELKTLYKQADTLISLLTEEYHLK